MVYQVHIVDLVKRVSLGQTQSRELCFGVSLILLVDELRQAVVEAGKARGRRQPCELFLGVLRVVGGVALLGLRLLVDLVQNHAMLGRSPNVFVHQFLDGNKLPLSSPLDLSSQVSVIHIDPLHMDMLRHEALLQQLPLVLVVHLILSFQPLLSLSDEPPYSLPSLTQVGGAPSGREGRVGQSRAADARGLDGPHLVGALPVRRD